MSATATHFAATISIVYYQPEDISQEPSFALTLSLCRYYPHVRFLLCHVYLLFSLAK